jgi:hypothetical protein
MGCERGGEEDEEADADADAEAEAEPKTMVKKKDYYGLRSNFFSFQGGDSVGGGEGNIEAFHCEAQKRGQEHLSIG